METIYISQDVKKVTKLNCNTICHISLFSHENSSRLFKTYVRTLRKKITLKPMKKGLTFTSRDNSQSCQVSRLLAKLQGFRVGSLSTIANLFILLCYWLTFCFDHVP